MRKSREKTPTSVSRVVVAVNFFVAMAALARFTSPV